MLVSRMGLTGIMFCHGTVGPGPTLYEIININQVGFMTCTLRYLMTVK